MATGIATVMKCKAPFSALGILLQKNVLGNPSSGCVVWLDHARTRSNFVMHNKERFVDNSKKKSLQDCVMIIRFLNTAKGFFPLGTFIVVIPKQYCPCRAFLREMGPVLILTYLFSYLFAHVKTLRQLEPQDDQVVFDFHKPYRRTLYAVLTENDSKWNCQGPRFFSRSRNCFNVTILHCTALFSSITRHLKVSDIFFFFI